MIPQPDTAYIYCLCDPVAKEVRYVGSTQNPGGRYASHCSDRSGRSYPSAWVRDLWNDQQVPPQMIVVEKTTDANRFTLEEEWIARFRELGQDLLNFKIIRPEHRQTDRVEKKMGRPPRPEKKYVLRSFRFPPELWQRLEAMAPPKGRSSIIHEGLRRELDRRERRAARARQAEGQE